MDDNVRSLLKNTPLEFEIDGQTYRAAKLSAFQQFNVSRRISPLIPPLIPVLAELSRKKASMDTLPAVLQPLADSLSKLSDEDSEFVLGTCLSVVRRRADNNWAAIWNVSAKRAMFDELNDIAKVLPIVIRVIQDNLSGFITGVLTGQAAPDQTPAA